MDSSKKKILLVTLIFVVLCCAYYLLQHNIKIHKEKSLELPRVSIGKSIEYFDLKTLDGQKVDKSVLEGANFSLIFIFSQKCPSCDHNINFWKKMTESFRKKADFFGIVLTDINSAAHLADSKGISFNFFSPVEKERFIEEFNVKFNLSQTILLENDKVIFSRSGDLQTADYFKIRKILRRRN